MVSLAVMIFKSPGTLNLFILYFPVYRILYIIYTEAQCLLHNWSGNESWSSALLKNMCSDSSYPSLPCVEYTQGHILLTPKIFSFLIRSFCTRFLELQTEAVSVVVWCSGLVTSGGNTRNMGLFLLFESMMVQLVFLSGREGCSWSSRLDHVCFLY